ncbi:MAG: hypothetical protein AAF823_00385 [Planctomycetota bacterium]
MARLAAEQARARWAGMSMGRAWFIWPLAIVLVGMGWWSAVGPRAVGFAPVEVVGAQAEDTLASGVVLQTAPPPDPLVIDLRQPTLQADAAADTEDAALAQTTTDPPRVNSLAEVALTPTEPRQAAPRPLELSPTPEQPAAAMAQGEFAFDQATTSISAAPLPWGDAQLALASPANPTDTPPSLALPFVIDGPTSPRRAARATAEHVARPVPPAMPDSSRTTRVVYMVDLSGSLVDSLPEAVRYIGDELDRLEQPAVFTVLFFRRGEVIEPPPHGLKPATFDLKWEVYDWIRLERGHLEAGGKATLSDAVLAALRYEVDRVVLLSDDGFGRDRSWTHGPTLLDDIAMTLPNAETVIDTVQFFYRDEAGAMEAIADRFGGGYTFVNRPMPDTEPEFVDLYSELREQGVMNALK